MNIKLSFMKYAFNKAKDALKFDEIPIGAIIVKNNFIISQSHNVTYTVPDPIGHAEILAIRMACCILNSSRLVDCDLYVTLEPCAMCAAAISFARIRRIYYGASGPKGGAIEHGSCFFNQPTCHHTPEIYSGIYEEKCGEILKNFFFKKRKKSILSLL